MLLFCRPFIIKRPKWSDLFPTSIIVDRDTADDTQRFFSHIYMIEYSNFIDQRWRGWRGEHEYWFPDKIFQFHATHIITCTCVHIILHAGMCTVTWRVLRRVVCRYPENLIATYLNTTRIPPACVFYTCNTRAYHCTSHTLLVWINTPTNRFNGTKIVSSRPAVSRTIRVNSLKRYKGRGVCV